MSTANNATSVLILHLWLMVHGTHFGCMCIYSQKFVSCWYVRPRACEQLVGHIVLLRAEAFWSSHIISSQWYAATVAQWQMSMLVLKLGWLMLVRLLACSRIYIEALLAHTVQTAMHLHWSDISHRLNHIRRLDAGSGFHSPSRVVPH